MKHRIQGNERGRAEQPTRSAERSSDRRMGATHVPDHRTSRVPATSPPIRTTLTDSDIREAWLRAEACCECDRQNHGHLGRCDQFLLWAERGQSQKGGWEARLLQDPRRPICEILCAACYAKSMGHSAPE